MSAQRIGLIGEFGAQNVGNDASLEAMLNFLRVERPEAEIIVICQDPARIRERFGVKAVPLALNPPRLLDRGTHGLLRAAMNWWVALADSSLFDALVFPGTGVLDDYLAEASGSPSQVFRWCAATRWREGRVAFVSVGAGPIRSDKSRRLLKKAALLAHHRSYRDADSRDFMMGLGLDESNKLVLPDIVHLLPAPRGREMRAGPSLTVGLGVMAYSGWPKDPEIGADYEDKLARFVVWLEGQGHRVKLLIAKPADMRCLNAVQEKAGRDKSSRLPSGPIETLHDVMRETADVDIVVASRFHILVAAMKTGRPVISLSYGPKNDCLMQDAGLGAFRQPAECFDFELLTRQFTQLARERMRYHTIVTEYAAQARARLESELKVLLFEILG